MPNSRNRRYAEIIAVADHRAQDEDGFGAVQAPACSGDVEPSPMRWRQALSIIPVAMGHPAAFA
jgi:hypothetical protein